jgi:hypothetical protein
MIPSGILSRIGWKKGITAISINIGTGLLKSHSRTVFGIIDLSNCRNEFLKK